MEPWSIYLSVFVCTCQKKSRITQITNVEDIFNLKIELKQNKSIVYVSACPAVEEMAAAAMAEQQLLTEAKKLQYFSSINSMARKIMEEREKIKERHGSDWDQMSPVEQDTAIDNGMMDPRIRARYAMHRVEREELVCFPKLLLQTGQKIVHFGDEVRGVWVVRC